MYLRHNYKIEKSQPSKKHINLEFYKQYHNESRFNFEENKQVSINRPDYYKTIYKDEEVLNPVSYDKASRYAKVKTIKKTGKRYHVTNRERFVNYSNLDKSHIVTNKTVNRLDVVSNDFYGTPIYWWLIAEANLIFDPLSEMYVGQKLIIPYIDNLNNYLK